MARTKVKGPDGDGPSRSVGQRQQQVQEEELREAVRILLMRPLLGPQHEGFQAARPEHAPKKSPAAPGASSQYSANCSPLAKVAAERINTREERYR